MWSGIKVTTPPTVLPISIVDLKQRLKIESPDEDDALAAMLDSAIGMVDGPDGIGYALMEQTWQKSMDCFPQVILLPGAPVKSVSSVTYVSADGTTQTLDPTEYRVDVSCEPARITPAYGKSWPSIRHVTGAVMVSYVLGKAVAADVSAPMVTAVSMIAGTYFANRELPTEKQVSVLPFGAVDILKNHSRMARIA